MAIPTYVGNGAASNSTTTITPALPTGLAVNDILLFYVGTKNQVVTIANSAGGTWSQLDVVGQGTGGVTTATRVTVFWSRYNGTQTAPTTDDPGDSVAGYIAAFRGCKTTGNPWNVESEENDTTDDTSLTVFGAVTTVADCLVVVVSMLHDDGSQFGTPWVNADLANITERLNTSWSAGNDGRMMSITGEKATAGAYGATTNTLTVSGRKSTMTIALEPESGMVGTIAVTQEGDVGALTGTVLNPITGTIAVTQAAQTMAASGTETISGTIAVTQDAQTGAFAGVSAAPVTGTLASTQADQTRMLTGSLGIIGTIAVTQSPQIATGGGGGGGGWPGIVANPITGTIGVTQANQTSVINGTAVSDGTLSAIQANQTGAFNGTVANPITGVIGASQASQTGALSGTVSAVAVVGTIAVTEEHDTAAFSGAQTLIAVTGVLNATQANQTGSFTALNATAVTGTIAAIQADQTMTAAGHIGNPQEGAVVTVTCELGGPTVTCTVSPAMIIAGSNAVVTAKFYDTFGTLSDPGTVTATVQAPDGTVSNPTPASSSTGIWTTTIPTDQAGYWFYQISGTGVDMDVVCTGSFCAQPSLVLV